MTVSEFSGEFLNFELSVRWGEGRGGEVGGLGGIHDLERRSSHLAVVQVSGEGRRRILPFYIDYRS